ncbi:MAG: hypothetical protein HFI69_03305 [Lachnospiraceae bacterium]|nr:hypothetical protein [Lachnospiraceae bacterium]
MAEYNAVSTLVQHCANNYTNHLPAFPIAQVKNPQRSPLRLRFLTCILRKAFCVIDPVICRTMYWLGEMYKDGAD